MLSIRLITTKIINCKKKSLVNNPTHSTALVLFGMKRQKEGEEELWLLSFT